LHPGEEAERCAEVLQVQALARRALVPHGLLVALAGLRWQQALRPDAVALQQLCCVPAAAQRREWGVVAVQLSL
jgi:hypothetical protein